MLKLALPKGSLQGSTAEFLEKAEFGFGEYKESSRSYRPKSKSFAELFSKVFHEKDIAIQVAIGNYDLAICGLDWIQELLVKYHSDAIVKVRNLGYGKRNLFVAQSRFSEQCSIEDIRKQTGVVRIVSEYPNLAEAFALKARLRRFRVIPVWGATDAYPPEHAELAIVSAISPEELIEKDLIPIAKILTGNAWLIANRDSMESKDLSSLLERFYLTELSTETEGELSISQIESEDTFEKKVFSDDAVSLAIADGHQQSHTSKFIKDAGIKIKGYRQPPRTRRPVIDFDGMDVKIIRPQDMPLQVANGNFDLAITGTDWLSDQLYQFPSSPVEELVNLGFGRVRIVVVVHKDLPVETTSDLKDLVKSGRIPVLRIATEYTNIADKYACDNHLSPYRVIPSWGATEAFLPEDADVLIENTETGKTLEKNNLKIIETLFESTGCLIGNSNSLNDPSKKEKMTSIIEMCNAGMLES